MEDLIRFAMEELSDAQLGKIIKSNDMLFDYTVEMIAEGLADDFDELEELHKLSPKTVKKLLIKLGKSSD